MLTRVVLGIALTMSLASVASAQYPGMPYRHRPTYFPQEHYYERMANQWVRLYLNRAPTQRELLLITSQLRTGRTHEEVQANIIASDEYWRKSNGNMSNFVRHLYLDVLGRRAAPAEVGMLIGQAVAKGRYRFALEFLVANQGINRGTPIFTTPIILNYRYFPILPF